MRATFTAVFWLLGLFISVPAIISLIQHVWHVGLAAYFSNFVDFYRQLTGPFFAALYAPLRRVLDHWSIAVPPWLQDLHALSFVGGGIFVRAMYLYSMKNEEHRELRREYGFKYDLVGMTIKTQLLSLLGFGLIILPIVAISVPALLIRGLVLEPLGIAKPTKDKLIGEFVLQACAVAAAVTMFYVLNATAL